MAQITKVIDGKSTLSQQETELQGLEAAYNAKLISYLKSTDGTITNTAVFDPIPLGQPIPPPLHLQAADVNSDVTSILAKLTTPVCHGVCYVEGVEKHVIVNR